MSSVWRDLEARAEAGGGLTWVRVAGAHAAVAAFRAVAPRSGWPEGRRELLIHLRARNAVQPGTLPSWDGLEIGTELHDVQDIHHGVFLTLRQGLPGTASVFEAVADDLCAAIQSLVSADGLTATLSAKLDVWKAFFDEHGTEGLSPEARRGLYGELWFLRERMAPTIGIAEAVRAWAGPRRAQQDFESQGVGLEVKTTVAVHHRRVSIASTRQLDDTGLRALVLAVVSLSEQDTGETLPMIVRDVAARVAPAGAAVTALYLSGIRAAGYLEAHAARYARGQIFRALHLYRVRDGFPRILESDLRPGVGEVRYQVDLGACTAFLMDESRLGGLLATDEANTRQDAPDR